MRFMMIVKSAESSGRPPQELMEAIAKISEEASKNGTMIGSGGVGPTALGARVRLSGGQLTVIDGPFTEAKEIAILSPRSRKGGDQKPWANVDFAASFDASIEPELSRAATDSGLGSQLEIKRRYDNAIHDDRQAR